MYASIYFLMWTQVGSFLVFFSFIYLYVIEDILFFFELSGSLAFAPSLLILVGFGIKVPLFPFHFWLTKTHVEAPTFFSIYLSGFLVKTAVCGLYLFFPYFHPLVGKLAVL